MKKRVRIANLLVLVSIVAGVAHAWANEELKDPRTRDEDISATEVTANITRLDSGLYEYVYTVVSPAGNKGRILDFSLDVACDMDFPPTAFPEPPDPKWRISSDDGKYVPLQGYRAPDRQSGPPSISVNNFIGWLLVLMPGNDAAGMRIVSPAPPGPRAYELTPSMDTEGWDYEPYEESGGVPWIPDFTVSGVTTGPACATEPVEEPARFPGSLLGGGLPRGTLERLNWLLSYSAPLRDRLHLPAGTTTYPITIHYAETIDPATFKVEPPHLRALFHPRPGTSEQVVLPLDRSKTKLALEVRPIREPPGTSAPGAKRGVAPTPAAEAARGEGLKLGQMLGDRKDRDVFEFRVDPSTTLKGRKQQ